MKFNITKIWSKFKLSHLWWGIGALVAIAALTFVIIWSAQGKATVDSAMDAYKAGKVDQALELFNRAKDKNQIVTAEEWNIYGNVYRDSKHLPEAIEAYEKAIGIDSGYETAYRNLSYAAVDLAAQQNSQQPLQDAIAVIEAGHKSHPKSVTLVEDLIMLYGKVGNSAKVSELTAIRAELLKS